MRDAASLQEVGLVKACAACERQHARQQARIWYTPLSQGPRATGGAGRTHLELLSTLVDQYLGHAAALMMEVLSAVC